MGATNYSMLCYAKSLQSCPTLRPQGRQPTRLPRSWDSPGYAKSQLIGRDPDAGKDGRQKEKRMTEDEMVGWHH